MCLKIRRGERSYDMTNKHSDRRSHRRQGAKTCLSSRGGRDSSAKGILVKGEPWWSQWSAHCWLWYCDLPDRNVCPACKQKESISWAKKICCVPLPHNIHLTEIACDRNRTFWLSTHNWHRCMKEWQDNDNETLWFEMLLLVRVEVVVCTGGFCKHGFDGTIDTGNG